MKKLTVIISFILIVLMLSLSDSFAGGVEIPPKCLALGEVVQGVPTPDQKCCAGLQLGDIKENYDKHCVNLGAGGYGGVCIACGNGVCDPAYETACNCPQDCPKTVKDKDDNRDKDKHDKKDRDGRKNGHDRHDWHDDNRDHNKHDDDGDRGNRGGMMQQ